jgi:type I restriction enzyme R subunit
MEEIRQRLRDLVTFADKNERKEIYTAFKDEGGMIQEVTDVPYAATGVNVAQYKKKVEQFIRDHEDYVVIQKIHWGIPLNTEDLEALETFFYQAEAVGGQEQFVQIYGQQENLAAFIRSLVGLDRAKAKERFARFLDGQTYTADQIRFVNYIIDHLTANGTIAPELLYGQPYTDIHYQGLTGVFTDTQAKALLQVVQAVNVVVR